MFRAIDPDGLAEIADRLVLRAAELRREGSVASWLLRCRTGSDVAGALMRAARWADQAAADLRWRASAIGVGQQAGLDLAALVRAEFAAGGVFAPEQRDAALIPWLRDRGLSRRRIADAVDRIGEWLDQGWLDWDVTNSDLHNVRRTLASLAGDELDQVLAALSPRQLERWVAEMGNSYNGFSRAEKQDVFELLATNASGNTLVRLHDALLTSGGQTDLIDLGVAIQLHSPDRVIADFVVGVLRADQVTQRFSSLAPGKAIQGLQDPTEKTRAAGAVLVHPNALSWFIVDSLTAGESPTPLLTALSRTTAGSHLAAGFVSALTLLTTPGQLDRMAAAQRSSEASSDEHHSHPGLDATGEHLLDASVRFLAANPDAVFTDLATNADPDGDLTTAFWHLLVSNGDAESMAAVLQGLRGGAAIDLDRFSARGRDPGYEYPHARNLAFAAATLNRGMTRSAQDAQGDIDAISRVAGVATTAAGLISGGSAVAESLIGTGTGWTIESFAAAAKSDINDQLADLIDKATARLRPPDGADLGQFAGAANALLAWTSVYTRLLPYA
ncbi:MAG: hypothetical protein QNJ75_10285 [Acidimicrobiia bacterium]|nr:hypothetical protein [Acidimicrobiia bacterium]